MAGLYTPVELIFKDDSCGIEQAMKAGTQGYRLGTQMVEREGDRDTGFGNVGELSAELLTTAAGDLFGSLCTGDFPRIFCGAPPQAIHFDGWKGDVDWSSGPWPKNCISEVFVKDLGGSAHGGFLSHGRFILHEAFSVNCLRPRSSYADEADVDTDTDTDTDTDSDEYSYGHACQSRFGAVYERSGD